MLVLPSPTLAVVFTQLFDVADHSKSTEGQDITSGRIAVQTLGEGVQHAKGGFYIYPCLDQA